MAHYRPFHNRNRASSTSSTSSAPSSPSATPTQASTSIRNLTKTTSHESPCYTISPFTKSNSIHLDHSTSNSQHNRCQSVPDRNPGTTTIHPSLLQPRLAVVLNVPPSWHPWLFASRLLSIVPAIWWGLPSALHLLLRLLPGQDVVVLLRSNDAKSLGGGDKGQYMSRYGDLGLGNAVGGELAAAPYAMTEAGLATIWCFASGYLSFFFTDCLMSRWLINYTPQATIVRLLTVNAINAYTTSTFLTLSGGFEDPRLLLPGWVSIATTLTMCYHITHQKINIRKETSTSINVFSIASYISMVTLLLHMLMYQPTYPSMPLVVKGKEIWESVLAFVNKAQTHG